MSTSEAWDLEGLRAETPGCAHRRHLNNAGASLQPSPVLDAVSAHLGLEAQIGGYEAAASQAAALEAAYASIAELVGCAPRNVALVENATAGFGLALSSIPFERGDLVLTTRSDYASNQIMYLSLARRLGIEVVRAPEAPEGGADLGAIEELLNRRRPRLVAISHIPTHTGLVQPAAEIGRLCRERDVPYLLDACQTVGQRPVDFEALGCDFLTATSRKFLRGPRGIGFLIVSDRTLERGLEPLLIDVHGAEWSGGNSYSPRSDARRFENWEFPYALILGMAEAARYALRLGLERIAQRTTELAARARARLASIPGIESADRGFDLAAIVALEVAGCQPGALLAELHRRGINTSISQLSPGIVELEGRKTSWFLRASPHYYNSWDEIEALATALEELVPNPFPPG